MAENENSTTSFNHKPNSLSEGGTSLSGHAGNADLGGLNPAQLEAVTYCESPQLVIAGAGSGKTRVLTYKIAYLLQHHDMKPWNILALTFTNKAAREMKSRIAAIVGEEKAAYLQMGTFHSIFARILRYEADSIGFTNAFTIYDETDSRSLIKNITKEMGLDDKTYKPAAVHSAISMAKNQLQTADEYANDWRAKDRDQRRNMAETHKIFMAYQQRLRQANAMDFDDLLTMTFRLFRDNEDIRRKYAERFQYVLVDEYQDTNFAQQQIVMLLTKENPHVCVVGDDYQSIYAFRGANIANILHFSKIYPTAKLFKLEQNYRSTQNIVAAANSLMKHNRQQIDKDVYSRNAEGSKIVVLETASDKREATMVCNEIKRLIREERLGYKDFAILYRTNAQSRTFEEEMRKAEVGLGAHYRIYGGLSFYQRKEVKDVIAYFRLVANPNDEEAFRRVINYPTRGIGNTTIQKIIQAAQDNNVSLWDAISRPAEYGLAVNRGTMAKIESFRTLLMSFMENRQTADALTLGKDIITKSGIETDLATDKTPEGDARRENVDALVSGIASFVQDQQEAGNGEHVLLSDYLSTVSLLTDADNDDSSDEKITLMTIHSAKGLEFNTVFVVGMEENIFPSMLSVDSDKALEEERRLLYVAITRAEKHCYLTWAHTRWRYGKMDGFVKPSRFLEDIDRKYITQRSDGGMLQHSARSEWARTIFDDDYEINKPYTGYHAWGDGYTRRSGRMQNSRPVAGQFMADSRQKETAPHRPEAAVNPFSESLQRKLKEGGRWSKVSKAITNGGRSLAENCGDKSGWGRAGNSADAMPQSQSQTSSHGLRVGSIIEHQRFGKGTVTRLEGTGENSKATVEFEHNGQKQLLLKFARFTII